MFNFSPYHPQFVANFYALGPDMLCNLYLAKNNKIAYNSATTVAREKISTFLESLEF